MQFIASEGDTVTPGTKVAVISKSAAPSEAHVAPSEETSQKETPPPPPPEKPKVEAKSPKVESVKPQASKLASPSEPQLPPKERERRVRSFIAFGYIWLIRHAMDTSFLDCDKCRCQCQGSGSV